MTMPVMSNTTIMQDMLITPVICIITMDIIMQIQLTAEIQE